MRAVVLRSGRLVITEVPEPRVGPGQLLVEPIATGICGSDLSALEHTDGFLRDHLAIGAEGFLFDPGRDLVLGHEFTARVIEVGDGVNDYAPGDRIVALPHVVDGRGVHRTIGYSNDFPGGLAERVVVQAQGHLKIPTGVAPDLAAVTEPMATGLNGVLRSHIEVPAGAIVTGCGPVGLGAVVELSQRGIHPIVASDPSAVRRHAALSLGADRVVNPLDVDPVAVWTALAEPAQRLYVFEASGKQGLLNTLLYAVPPFTRIYVVGVTMTDDVIRPLVGVAKNLAIEFVGGPGPADNAYHAFGAMFRHLVAGRFNPRHVVTGYTGLEGVPRLFDLQRPTDPRTIKHVKVLVRHDLVADEIYALDDETARPVPAGDLARED